MHLTILRKGDTNIVDLAEVGSLIPHSETQVDSAFLHELAAEVARIATPGYNYRDGQNVQSRFSGQPSNAALRDLQRIGGLIFSHLLTEPARKRLRAADPCDLYLRLDEQLIHVPWELGFDGKDFLATKFRVGWQVITRYPLPEVSTGRQPNGPLRVLFIADPTESLPEAGVEAEQLCALLDEVPSVEVTLRGGRGVRKVPLLAELQAHEVVHFAGHSFYDPDNPSQSGWRLHEGVLTAGELSKLTHPPLLVFSNSCQAGATTEWRGNYRYEGQAFSIGSAFLLAGVQNYIGTFWVIHDAESVVFASAFYRSLAVGLSLGAALVQARQAVIRQRNSESLTWASYMLYGDPAFTLLPVAESPRHEHTMQKPSPEPPTPPVPKEKKQQWTLLSSTPSRKWIIFFFSLIAPFSYAYWLSQNQLPSQSPPSFVLREYEKAFAALQVGQLDAAQTAFRWIATNPENTTGLGYDGLAAIYFEKGLLTEQVARTAAQKQNEKKP
jgi:hypothetical protein